MNEIWMNFMVLYSVQHFTHTSEMHKKGKECNNFHDSETANKNSFFLNNLNLLSCT